MTTSNDQARPRFLGLGRFRWKQLAMRQKLLLPTFGLLLISLLILLMALSPILTTFALQGARTLFGYRLDGLQKGASNLLLTAQPTLLDLVDMPEIQALAQASTDPAIQSQVQDAFRNALIRQVDFTVTPFETIRVLGVDGQQLAVARYHRTLSLPVILPPTERTSEADNPYFKQLLQVPAGKAIVLPPHLSAQRSSDGSPELVIEIGVPVFASAKLVGFVIGGLFARDRLLELMRPSAYDTLRVALYDSNNTLIAATNPAAFSDVKVFLAGDPQLGQLGAPGDLPLKTGQTLQPFGDRLYSSAYIASVLGFHFVGWTVVISESTSTIFAESNAVYGTLSLVILGLLLVAGVVIFFLSRALTEPLVQVSQAAEQAARGEFRVDLHIDSQDEVGTLASALTVMSRRVSELIGTLEKRVAERTRNIEIVAEISRNAAQVRDIDRLLQTAVDDIRDRFNFYHAQIFLVDDIRQYAVLVTSTGEPGRILLARSHKLAIGSDSIVGQVVEKGRTFITLDTEKSEVQWRFNPVLPDTRSEMGLPLRLGDTVIGVLDIQSTKQEAFSQADVEVFEVLADQLAVAIDSARLLQETGRRVQQIDDLNRRLTRESWTEYAATRDDSELAYRYDLLNTSPGADGLAGTSVDIRVRGQSVGSLSVYENPALPLSEDDKVLLQSVAERVSLAVENVRLVEQTQIALAEIERLYTASRELGSTVNVEEVYAVAANYLKAFEALDRLSIMRASPDPVIWPQYLTYVYTWSRDAGDSNPVQTTGRIPRAALPFDRLLPDPFKPANIVLDEARLGPVLYSSMKSLGMQSLLAVPIATSTHWYGTLMCSSRRSTLFPPSFERFATAIADELSIIIDNRRLFEEAQTEARRNRALAEAVEVATRIGDEFETGVDSLFRAVVTQAGYDRWWFGLMETIAGVVVLRRVTSHFTENSPLYHMARISMAGETNPLAEAAFLGEPVLVNEPETHHVLANLPGDQKQAFGKHIALPIRIDENVVGAFLIGRAVSERDLDESDMQFANTLANQLVVAFNNRQLFSAAETGRRTLQTIIDSLPTGVAVMDAESHELVLTNEVARSLLGLEAGEGYQLVHTNSGTPYAPDDFPPLRVLNTGVPVHSEDMTVIRADGQRTDLIVNATTTHTVSGEIISAVAVFQDVTELRELEDVLQESLRETTTLYEANRALAAEHSVQDILGILVAQMKGICHPDLFCAVFRDESGELRNFYQADAESGMNVVQVEGALALPAAILVEQDVFIADSISEDPYLAGRPDLANLKVGAIATFPLNVRQQTIGWLILGFQGPRAFTPEERRLLTSLSDQAAIALEGSRLSEATNRALEETRQLYEATYRINRAPSVESVLQIVRDEVLRFGPSKIDMALVQADSATIQWVLDYDRADPASETIRLDTEAPLFEDRLLIDADAYFVGDIADAPADTLTTIQRLPGWERWAAHAAVPFTVKGRATGRLIIGFEERHEFARFERQFFSTIADQAAIVIDNASLIRQTQNSLEEIGTLYELSKEIMDSTDLSQILQVIIDHAAQPAINEAALIRLLAPSWTAPQATLEISASWDNELGMAVPSSQRLNREQYPLWDFVAQKEITWVADTDLESATRFNAVAREMLRGRNICSLVVVPLISGRRPIGALLIGASEAWPAGEREQRIYAALADQVAITMENRNLLQQAEQRARQLQISADVAHAASTILNLDELFDRTVNLIKDSFGYDHTQIFLVTEDNRDARLVASTGEAGRKLLSISHHLEVGSKSVIGQVTALGKPQIAANVSEIGVVWRPNPYLPNTRSEMALPLIARGRTLGALDVQSNEAGVFTLEDQEVLTNLANQIAVAIDNARLFETSTRRADEMRFLFDVTNVASTELIETQEAYERILKMVLEMTRADQVVLSMQADSDEPIYTDRYRAFIGVDGTIDYNTEMHTDGRVYPFYDRMARGETIFDNDVAQNEPSAASFSFGAGSVISVPIQVGDTRLGAIVVVKKVANGFEPAILTLLQTMSSSLASVLQNTRLLREVQEANERLREVDKLKSQFLANMSHELRTPLNSIIGFSRVILKGIDGPLTDTQEQDLATIHESGKHLLNLVNDILDQAKIEAGKMELSYGYFSVPDLVKSVMSTAVGLVKDKPVRLHQEIESELPNVYGDEFRSRQVLLNLISNAAKFTNQGSITASAFRVEENGRHFVQVCVTDTGIGIPTDKLESIFEAFQQVESSPARQYEGTGLGLPIARSLIQMQGGRIWVDSELGVGSTFSFTVPLEPLVPEPAPDAEPVEPQIVEQVTEAIAKADTPQSAHRIVLAVDDEVGMINLYRRYLAKGGYEVIGAKPEEAEELARVYQPRVILLDIVMPNLSGWEVLDRLKDHDDTFNIPVIVCSIEDHREQAFRLGAADYLIKSIDEQTLIDAVKRVELERDCRKILIIDDQPESVRLIHDALATDDRFKVVEAIGGLQGLEMVRGHWPDLIILDLRMPEMDGLEVWDKLKGDPDTATIPVLVVTADDITDSERERLQGAHLYHKQTVNVDELLQNVVSQLSW